MNAISAADRIAIRVLPDVLERCAKCRAPIVTRSGGYVSFKGTHLALFINRDGEVAFKGRCPKCQSGHEIPQPDLLLEEHGKRFAGVRQ